MSKNNYILLISSDSFIIGLLNGYSVANNIVLESASDCKILQSDDISKGILLIIIDLRELKAAPTNSNLKFLYDLKRTCNIPICAIRNSSDKQIVLSNSWIDCFFGDPVAEELDKYFLSCFRANHSASIERRAIDRRKNNDRRSFSVDQANNQSHSTHTNSAFSLGPFMIDDDYNAVFLSDKNLELTCKEFKLFSLLASNVEHVFKPDEIIRHLWPTTYRANKSDLYQYMHLLRKKIEKDPDNPLWIKTIKGAGYKLHIPSSQHEVINLPKRALPPVNADRLKLA